MEALQEAIFSRNIVAWIIIALLVILFLKLLQSAGKGLLLLVVIVALSVVLFRYFPDVVAPLVEFVQGGWQGGGGAE